MARVSGILETCIYVDDMDRAVDFYSRVLEFEVIANRGPRHVFLRLGGGVLILFDPKLTQIPHDPGPGVVPPHGAHGPGHVCFVAEPRGIDDWRAHLLSAGVEIEAEFPWPNGARSLYFRDPAGNSLEFAERKLWD